LGGFLSKVSAVPLNFPGYYITVFFWGISSSKISTGRWQVTIFVLGDPFRDSCPHLKHNKVARGRSSGKLTQIHVKNYHIHLNYLNIYMSLVLLGKKTALF